MRADGPRLRASGLGKVLRVMTVTAAHNKVVFTVESGDTEYRALQLASRIEEGGRIYAAEYIAVGDTVLVCEIPQFISSKFDAMEPEDSISHVILGIVPPSNVDDIARELVG